MSLNWMKSYSPETVIAATFEVDEKTLRYWAQTYTLKIQALKDEKVSPRVCCFGSGLFDYFSAFPSFYQVTWVVGDKTFVVSVDGVHCRINEPRKQPSATWYSHKFHSPALAYEIGLSIYTSEIIWVNGPFPAATHDLTIFRAPNGLLSQIPLGNRAIGDRGYSGEPLCSVRSRFDTPEVREFKRRVRARHEIINARIKAYHALDTRFRHGMVKHKIMFEAVCVLVQYDMEHGHPLFDV
jgi:hypothetical protein